VEDKLISEASVTTTNPSSAKPKKQAAPEISELAEHVGNFTQHWGFKHIHGRIWLHLFVSAQPLDAGALIRRTGVSKALMSMSLKELLAEKWIRPTGRSAAKTQLFDVNEDFAPVLGGVLRARTQTPRPRESRVRRRRKGYRGKTDAVETFRRPDWAALRDAPIWSRDIRRAAAIRGIQSRAGSNLPRLISNVPRLGFPLH
jgi:hypothetical protein